MLCRIQADTLLNILCQTKSDFMVTDESPYMKNKNHVLNYAKLVRNFKKRKGVFAFKNDSNFIKQLEAWEKYYI